ncbi:hypothetical protein D3C81_491460 [compost metagenome]
MVGKHQPSPSANFFYVFCNIWEDLHSEPEMLVVPSDHVSRSVDWNAKVPLFKIQPEEKEKYQDNWNQILCCFSKQQD